MKRIHIIEHTAALFPDAQDFSIVRWESAEAFLAAGEAVHSPKNLLIIQLELPGMNGVDLLRKLYAKSCPSPLIIVADTVPRAQMLDIIRFGAAGCLLRNELYSLEYIIETIKRGAALLSPSVSLCLMTHIARTLGPPCSSSSAESPGLSNREKEVAFYLISGYSVPDISDALCISVHTVRVHIKNIHHKLGISKREELNGKAEELGLVLPAPSMSLNH